MTSLTPTRRSGPWTTATLLTGVLGLGVLSLGPTAVEAQSPRWEATLTGARIQYDSLAALNAPSVSGLLEWRGPELLARIGTGITGFQNAGWTAQGSGDVSRWLALSGAGGPVHLEVAGAANGSRHSSGFETYLVRGDLRLHARSPSFGGWVGAGVAQTQSSFDSTSVRGVVPNVGAWSRFGPVRLTLAYQAPEVLDRTYHEATTSLGYSGERLDLTTFAGWRRAPSGTTLPNEAWAGASAAVWLSGTAALVVSGGRYGPDVLQGLPGGEYVSVGFKLTRNRVRPAPESPARAPLLFSEEVATRGSIGFEVEGAETVEVAGDWNDWTPEPLARDRDDRWTLPAGLAPGIYRFNLRVDGTRWVVPDGVPSSDDGFGGEVGILIITEGS
ncbi:MAG: glycogen-binding domain-containing protein [Gemmatimonadota bacterium]